MVITSRASGSLSFLADFSHLSLLKGVKFRHWNSFQLLRCFLTYWTKLSDWTCNLVDKWDKFQSTFATSYAEIWVGFQRQRNSLHPATLFYSIAHLQVSHYTAHFLYPYCTALPKTRAGEGPKRIDFQCRSYSTCTERLESGQLVKYCGLASRLCYFSRKSRRGLWVILAGLWESHSMGKM